MSAVQLLSELLAIDTTNPPGNEAPAAELLRARLNAAGFATDILASPEGRPNLVARLPGAPDAPALVLLSHTDVVPVEREHWTQEPFGGGTAEGHIWGRGTLDMKGTAVMHVEAAVRAAAGAPTREIIVVAVADEETGGSQGAKWLIDAHPDAVGFRDGSPPPEVLGEGAFGLSGILDRPVMTIAVGEKHAAWIDLKAQGEPGHGSQPPTRMAPRDLATVISKVAGYGTPRVHPVMKEQFRIMAEADTGVRARLFKAMSSGAGNAVSRVVAKRLQAESRALASLLSDTVSPTQIHAGYKHNVIPAEAHAALDCRLLPDTNTDEFVERLRRLGEPRGVTPTIRMRSGGPEVSGRGGLYRILEDVSAKLPERPIVAPSLCPGITDVRFFRAKGAQGYGWVPIVISRELLGTIHGHDERIPLEGFERAVDAMSEAVQRASS